MTEEPRERLRRARDDAGVSRAELAARTGRAQSTIRAHETGQNRIQPDAAAEYGEALGVSPSWILYGNGTPFDKSVPQKDNKDFAYVPVVGVLYDRFVRIRPAEDLKPSHLFVPRFLYTRLPLSAYRQQVGFSGMSIKYLLIAPYRRGMMRRGTEVVIRTQEGSVEEIAVWRVDGGKKVIVLSKDGESDVKFGRDDGLPDNMYLIGVVVGKIELSNMPPSWENDVLTPSRELEEYEYHLWRQEEAQADALEEEARIAESEADDDNGGV